MPAEDSSNIEVEESLATALEIVGCRARAMAPVASRTMFALAIMDAVVGQGHDHGHVYPGQAFG